MLQSFPFVPFCFCIWNSVEMSMNLNIIMCKVRRYLFTCLGLNVEQSLVMVRQIQSVLFCSVNVFFFKSILVIFSFFLFFSVYSYIMSSVQEFEILLLFHTRHLIMTDLWLASLFDLGHNSCSAKISLPLAIMKPCNNKNEVVIIVWNMVVFRACIVFFF